MNMIVVLNSSLPEPLSNIFSNSNIIILTQYTFILRNYPGKPTTRVNNSNITCNKSYQTSLKLFEGFTLDKM